MSSNGINECEDAEMVDCDGEKAVTMMDVLKEQEDFEEDANAVLGASDDKNCTFSKGYIKRQAIYACMTCCSEARDDPTKRAGVCLACSLNCHENHDLIELYTKRNFRCDCGNPKFNSHPCQFTPNKNDLNDENVYNQNYSGLYCVCHRPYPDPDATTEEEMIQCVVCEDWLHSSHLDAVVPANDQYTEMICKACMDKNEFLHDYSELAVNKVDLDKEENVDILNTSLELNETKCNGDSEMLDVDTTKSVPSNEQHNDDDKLNKENIDIEMNNEAKKVTEETKVLEKTETESINNETNPHPEEQVSEKISDIDSTVNEKQDNKIPSEEESNIENKSEEATPANVTENDNITETIQVKEKQIEEVNKQNEKSVSMNDEKEDTAKESTETATVPDNRTQEQVEEDLLLADPVATVQDNKADASTLNTCDSEQTVNTNVNIETKSESQTMDTTEPEDSTKDKSEKAEDKPAEGITEANKSVSAPESKDKEEKSESVPDTMSVEGAKNETELESVTESSQDKENESESKSVPKPTTENADENSHTVSKEEDENMDTNKIESNAEHKEIPATDENLIENDKANDANNDEVTEKKSAETTDVLKRKLATDTTEDSETKKPKLDGPQCVRPKGVKKIHKGATFWPSNFRLKLCTCNECISMYKDLSVLFLTDPEDTTIAYERLGKERTGGKPASQYEKGMAALSSLGHVQQINAMTEYGKLRDKLLEFLKSFKERKVVVKEEDIKAFFAGMKPVREPDGVYFCR